MAAYSIDVYLKTDGEPRVVTRNSLIPTVGSVSFILLEWPLSHLL